MVIQDLGHQLKEKKQGNVGAGTFSHIPIKQLVMNEFILTT